MGSSSFTVSVVATLQLLSFQTEAQDLAAITCNARLPTNLFATSPLYDGDDTIYLFGGFGPGGSTRNILKYSIGQDTLINAGQLPVATTGGNTFQGKNGEIYHFEQSYFESEIYQYFPDNQTVRNLSSLPGGFAFCSFSMMPDEDTILFFGFGGIQDPDYAISLDLNTFQTKPIGQLPTDSITDCPVGVWVDEEKAAYIYARFRNGSIREYAARYDLSTNSFEKIRDYFPRIIYFPTVVWGGTSGYMVGGLGSDEVPYDGILQFKPNTGETQFFRVENYPGHDGWSFMGTSAVYVERLNRIYMFGGRTYNPNMGTENFDKIWYISLDQISPPVPTTTSLPTSNPEIFDCTGLRESRHPFPGDCSKFILCRSNKAYSFHCPEPLAFHAKDLECTWPDLVDCEF